MRQPGDAFPPRLDISVSLPVSLRGNVSHFLLQVQELPCGRTQLTPLCLGNVQGIVTFEATLVGQRFSHLSHVAMLKGSRSLYSVLALVSLLAACASVTEPLPPPPQIGIGPPAEQPAYRLQPGDVIEVHILSNPELNEQVVVAPDNRVTFQFAPGLTVGGRSLQQVTDMLNHAYQTTTKNDLQVVLRSQVGTRCYVTGEVTAPTEVVTNGPISALSAITRAGGFKITAQRTEVVLMRRDEDNKPHLYALNLLAAMQGKDPNADVLLQPYDVLYVPRDRISNVSLVFERIRNAIPLSSSFGYYP
jgi:protein involved in polysaccharide export with SLBB domain